MRNRGRDPLDDEWVAAFFAAHGRLPDDGDRQDYLFSLIFPGRGPAGSWSDEDWGAYWASKRALWAGEAPWPAGDMPLGYDRFVYHLWRLAGHYGTDRASAAKFSRAAGLMWGGIAFEGTVFMALFRAGAGEHLPQLQEGPAGWRPEHVDDDNPAHHWVAAFVAGFAYGALLGAAANSIRDLAQMVTGLGGTLADIRLGNAAARHGALLRRASGASSGPGEPYVALLATMESELRDAG
ncbi:MAG: hypothetical protein ACK2UH_17635 [Candidatus Promineifilaceae bacterium]